MVFGIIWVAVIWVIVPLLPTREDNSQVVDTSTTDAILGTRPVWADDAETFDDTPSDIQEPNLEANIANDIVVDESTTSDIQ